MHLNTCRHFGLMFGFKPKVQQNEQQTFKSNFSEERKKKKKQHLGSLVKSDLREMVVKKTQM